LELKVTFVKILYTARFENKKSPTSWINSCGAGRLFRRREKESLNDT